jgi:Mn2+/Fe2+ NRAMP family transporter
MGLAVVLNTIVSILVGKRDDLSLFQKIAQILIIWLVPFLAAIGIFLLNKDYDDIGSRSSSFYNYGKDDRGDTSHIDL